MEPDIILPRKWRVRAGEQQTILRMGETEKTSHVLMKAFLWALYLPTYPHAQVEIKLGERYKPDVVAYTEEAAQKHVQFWGESGQVGRDKIAFLFKRYPDTHFAFAKWSQRLTPFQKMVEEALEGVRRAAPVDILSFPADSAARFIGEDNLLTPSFEDIKDWVRFTPS